MDKAANLFGDGTRPCIFAIGNAPTALIRLYELIQERKIKPALIIGAPVGFVNVIQSKELILSFERHALHRGRRKKRWKQRSSGNLQRFAIWDKIKRGQNT